MVELNGQRDNNNGMNIINGNLADNYETMALSGVMKLDRSDALKLAVYGVGDNYWRVHSETGFGLVRLHEQSSTIGFHADLKSTKSYGRGWRQVDNWDTSDSLNARRFNTGHFKEVTGRFVAPRTGIYYATLNLRIDQASGRYFRAKIAINKVTDSNTGLMAIDGSPNYRYSSLTVDGFVMLNKDDFVETYVYSNSDNSWRVHHESGFGVVFIS